MRRTMKVLLDLGLLALALPIALLLRENFDLVLYAQRFLDHLPLLVATLLAAVPILLMFGVDRVVWRFGTMADFFQMAMAVALTVFAGMLLTFGYNRLEGISRSIPPLQVMLAVTGMVGARAVLRYALARRVQPRPFAPIERSPQLSVLLVGLSALSDLYCKAICEFAGERVRAFGIVDHSHSFDGMRVQKLPVFGGETSIRDVIDELAVHGVFIDRVVVTTPVDRLTEAGRRDIERFSATSKIPVDYFGDSIASSIEWAGTDAQRRPQEGFDANKGGLAFAFTSDRIEQIAQRPYWRVKRCIDVVGALLLIALLWPVALVVALVVAWDVGLPVIFMQRRPGVGGRPFSLYKFRTMSSARDRNGNLRSDTERLTRIGQALRATRLDELPQLWNILAGEMSFIGPRPLLPLDQSPAFASRLLVRPGLTGWSQIHGGRKVSPEDKAALDVWYVANASLKLDIEIILGTLSMLTRGEIINRDVIDQAWRELRKNGIWRPHAVPSTPPPSPPEQQLIEQRKTA